MLTSWIVEQKASSGKRGLCAVKLTLLQDAPGGSASAPENGCNFVSVLKHLIKFIIKSVIFPTAVTDQVALDQNETHRVVRFHPRRRCSKLVQTFHPHLTERETVLVIFVSCSASTSSGHRNSYGSKGGSHVKQSKERQPKTNTGLSPRRLLFLSGMTLKVNGQMF